MDSNERSPVWMLTKAGAVKPMTTEEMRKAAAGHHHEYRPSFKRAACSRCGRDRRHPSHGPRLPPLNCGCGTSVERPDLHSHMRSHGLFMCGLDPWKVTDASLAELIAFAESLKARAPHPESQSVLASDTGPGREP